MSRPANPELPLAIIREALEIVIHEGSEALNMRRIASRAGISATAVYRYFESKEALLLRLKVAAAERLNRNIQEIEDDPDPKRILGELGRIQSTNIRRCI